MVVQVCKSRAGQGGDRRTPRDSLKNQHDPLQILGLIKDSISNYRVESHRGRRAKLTSGLSVHARTPTKVKPQFSAI